MLFHHTRTSSWILLSGALLVVEAPVISAADAAPPPVAAPIEHVGAPVRGAFTDHVVLISIDGLRPDAIEKFRATTLLRLMREGSHSLQATTIMPSRTLPSHTSMLTGEEPADHGITWNSNETDDHGHSEVPTVFAKARRSGFHTAAFFSKGKFNHLAAPATLDHVRVPEGDGKWEADETVEHVEEYLEDEKPNLMFVHIGEPDYAGHKFSWMSWFYGRAVRRADAAVGKVLSAADRAFGEGNYSVIVTADHGGHGWDHGSSDARDVTIPWIAWGKGVKAGVSLPSGIRTMDTAATALWLLGVPESTVGNPVQMAFEPTMRAVTGAVADEATPD